MKIYTGSGDKGKTGLFSGERVSKANPRIDAYGDVDELNSVIGLISSFTGDEAVVAELTAIQAFIIKMSAWLATTPGSTSAKYLPKLDGKPAQLLENAMDRMDAELPKLKAFILPGGCKAASFCHMGRTVCRRAERKVVHFLENIDENDSHGAFEEILVFMNRLSDYLFVLARYMNHQNGALDIEAV